MEPFTWTHPNGKHANDDKLFRTLNKTASFIFMLYSYKSARAMLFALAAVYTEIARLPVQCVSSVGSARIDYSVHMASLV